jgi:hypothetical protein
MGVQEIFNLGDDSLSNEWEIVIPAFPGSLDISSTMLRVTEFNSPNYSIGTYPIRYKTQQFDKPNASIKTENTFTFNFRNDKYWQVYEGFENWLALIINPDTGVAYPDVVLGSASTIRTNIDVIPVDNNGVITKKGWTYQGCYITDLSGPKFSNIEDGAPFIATPTIHFVKRVSRT